MLTKESYGIFARNFLEPTPVVVLPFTRDPLVHVHYRELTIDPRTSGAHSSRFYSRNKMGTDNLVRKIKISREVESGDYFSVFERFERRIKRKSCDFSWSNSVEYRSYEVTKIAVLMTQSVRSRLFNDIVKKNLAPDIRFLTHLVNFNILKGQYREYILSFAESESFCLFHNV